MADNLRFFAGAARCLEGRAAGEYMEGYTSFTRREAVGVIGQVTPWNYPLMMAIWKFAPALAAGNTVVLKPAETTPMTTVRLAELAAESCRQGRAQRHSPVPDARPGEALINHPEVDMIALTGSVDTGKHFARTAADTLKRVHLELGGKAPVIVFDDVSIERRPGDDRRHRLLQRRPGLHGRHARARRRAVSTTTSSAASPSQAQGLVIGDTLCPRHDARPAQLRPPARARAGLPGAPPRRTPRSSPAARPPTARASTSSRRSSPVCARRTR